MNVIISNKEDAILSSLNIDVIKKISGLFSAEEIISMFANFYYEKMILDITALKDYNDFKNIQSLAVNLDASKLIILLDGSSETNSKQFISSLISVGIYNFTQNKDGIMYLMSKPNTYRDVANMQVLESEPNEFISNRNVGTRVIGVKNLTEHAGSTTFVYLLKKHLENNFKVAAVEVDKKDFSFFNDRNMFDVTSNDLSSKLSDLSQSFEIVILDLNNGSAMSCNDIIYLLEPSIIKLNKLVSRNRSLLGQMNGKKIILNKSLLSPKDINEFEMESGIKTFYSIPPLNDRVHSPAVDSLLIRMGFLSNNEEYSDGNNSDDGLLGLFKHRS